MSLRALFLALAHALTALFPSSPAAADPNRAVNLTDPGRWAQAFTAGRPPEPAHPRGTLFVAFRGPNTELIAEIDLATYATLGRVQVASGDSHVLFAQDGSHTYALIVIETERRVVEVKPGPTITTVASLAAKFEKAHDFTVVAGRPIVLRHGGGSAIALVFSTDGTLIAKRNCKSGMDEMWRYALRVRDGRVFITNLVDDDSYENVCAFDANGKGPVDVLKVGRDQSFQFEPTMELRGDTAGKKWVAAVNRRLQVQAKKRPAKEADPPKHLTCNGVRGTARQKTATVYGTLIILTHNCCGDRSPAGVWVCPNGPSPNPPPSSAP